MFSDGSAWISQDPSYSDDGEIDSHGLLDLAREYINGYASLQELRGEPDAIAIRDEYLKTLEVDRTGPYSTSVRELPGVTAPEQKATTSGYHDEVFVKYEKRLMVVGFDQNGKPMRKMDYDVLLRHKKVPD